MAKKKIETLIKEFRQDMARISKVFGIHASEIGRDQFLKESGWDRSVLDEIGQFSSLKKMYFPKVDVEQVKHGSQLMQSYRNKVDKQVGMTQFVADEMCKVFLDYLNKNPLKFHKPVKLSKKSKKKFARSLVANWSDSHLGANIKKSEVQINEYNWTIAARRMALFVEQLCHYKEHYRKDTELVFCLNGDILAGVIHDQEWFVDLLTHQKIGALSMFIQAITFLAQHFPKVRVMCSPGNHGRAMHKKGKDRATTHKFDSYETEIYAMLKMALADYSNIEVKVPKTPFTIFQVQGHNVFMTHGDTVINVGNPGSTLNMKEINNQINKLNASELGGAEKFQVMMVGHVHTATVQLTESGCMLLINGCSSGVDPFAQAIGIFSSNPTQQVFEVTSEHAVGDMRFIQLKPADQRTELDKIIKPYDPETEEF